MNDIIETAEKLGKAILDSDRFKAVQALRKELGEDQPLQADLKALNELSAKIAGLEKETKPVEPDDKRKVQELRDQVTGHPRMQDLARVEADFAELMNRVNRAIYGQLGA